MQSHLHQDERVNASTYIVYYDAKTLRKGFKLTHWRRLYNVESSKKYKAQQNRFPRERHCNHGDELSHDFIDHHELGIFEASCPRDARGGRNSYRGGQ